MEEEEKFSDNPLENIRIENELMKIKLKAQYGDAFEMESNEDLSPEAQHKFLKNIVAFGETYDKSDFITVYERIGKPVFATADTLDYSAIEEATVQLLALLNKYCITIDFGETPFDSETKYRFITEELFGEEVDENPADGTITDFVYEEFHPNHESAIMECAHQFLLAWFTRDFPEHNVLLSSDCVTTEGIQMSGKEMLDKINLFADAFKNFANDGYNIDKVSFELQPETERGMGFAEGMLKYDAEIDNNEIIHFEGAYKLYFQMEEDQWSVFYFVIPGFKW